MYKANPNPIKADSISLDQITETSEEQVKDTYTAARKAFQRLQKVPLKNRLEDVERLIDYVRDHKDEITDIICKETRKSRTDAMVSEVMGVLDNFEWLIHNAPKILKDKKVATPITLMGKTSKIYQEALGQNEYNREP